MSHSSTPFYPTSRLSDYQPRVLRSSLAMSPDRGSFHHHLDDTRQRHYPRDAARALDYTQFHYADQKQNQEQKKEPPIPPVRRNGFVFEDTYSKKFQVSHKRDYSDSGSINRMYDYSSPYMPIKPEYLTLPARSNYSKYATLPKSWSLSSSNSYKTHFTPSVQQNYHQSYSSKINLGSVSPIDEYRVHVRSRELKALKYSYEKEDMRRYRVNNDHAIVNNNSDRNEDNSLKSNTIVPWYMELENRKLNKAKRGHEQRIATNGSLFDQNSGQQRQMDMVKRTEETKKNVTFSEVRGCQESVPGRRPVQVRELEVSFSQIVDKRNMVREYNREKQVQQEQQQNKFKTGHGIPNGDCSTHFGTDKLPPKPDHQAKIISGLVRRKYLSQVIAALAVSLAPFAAGLGKGYSSPAIASLQQLKLKRPFNATFSHDLSVSDQQASWVASLSLLGALFGGVVGGIAMRHGRRKVLLMMSLPFSLSWIMTVFATSVEMMFFTSFVGGFCCSIVTMVSQVYVSEISLPDIRGCLNAVLKIIGHLGVLMSFTIGAYLDWQQLAMFISIAPIMLFCTMIYIPETPSYLVLCGKEDEAYKSLTWLRGPGTDIIQELATIRAHVLATKTFHRGRTVHRMADARIAGPVLITCGLMLFQRFSGAHAFNFYAVPIFRKTFGGMNPHGGAIAVSFVQLLASCLSGLLIDTVGRLPLLIASSVFMSMALAGFGSYAYYEEVHRNQRLQNMVVGQNGQNDWIPLLCVLVFTIAFSLGMSPISWLLIGELFPLEFRGTGSALATAFSYLCAFVGVKTFVDFQQMFGLHGAFWLYAVISVGGLCFVVCCVPETKGRDLDEMDPKSVQSLRFQR